ncbi:hypothetical protein C0J52_27715 [Blattella germanica]|nr:hypothetical protein C0J52_27715 [Blattella germanica]
MDVSKCGTIHRTLKKKTRNETKQSNVMPIGGNVSKLPASGTQRQPLPQYSRRCTGSQCRWYRAPFFVKEGLRFWSSAVEGGQSAGSNTVVSGCGRPTAMRGMQRWTTPTSVVVPGFYSSTSQMRCV